MVIFFLVGGEEAESGECEEWRMCCWRCAVWRGSRTMCLLAVVVVVEADASEGIALLMARDIIV